MEKEYKGYIVSSSGKVWKNGKEVGNKPNKNGYCMMSVKLNKRRRIVGRYKLVWEAFNGKVPRGMEIDHINRIRNDDRLENLRCVTHKENLNNPLTVEYIKSKVKVGNTCFGNTPKKVEQYKDGVLTTRYESVNNACFNNSISWWDIYESSRTNLIVNGFTYKVLQN